ncbi:hypothetical protein [Stenotrophomonas acidaminiphila]|uniref:hypothetical protein n=1 Tax=Stenotrophomonas acidaminiphila TaxID=128780 RepID=UPI0028A791FA|nr:hypothetical protein [Stenotrophomonas acidaminiphila]
MKATHEAVDIVRTHVLSFPRICSTAWWYCAVCLNAWNFHSRQARNGSASIDGASTIRPWAMQ